MLSTVGTTSFGSILDGQLMGRWGGTCRASSSASSCELSAQGLSSFHFQIQHRTRRTDKESRRGRRGDWTDAAADAGGHVRQQPKRGPSRDDRAAEIGRTLGGAFGLVVSGAILSNALSRDLTQRGYMDEKEVASLTISMYAPGVVKLEEKGVQYTGSIHEGVAPHFHILHVRRLRCAGFGADCGPCEPEGQGPSC